MQSKVQKKKEKDGRNVYPGEGMLKSLCDIDEILFACLKLKLRFFQKKDKCLHHIHLCL